MEFLLAALSLSCGMPALFVFIQRVGRPYVDARNQKATGGARYLRKAVAGLRLIGPPRVEENRAND